MCRSMDTTLCLSVPCSPCTPFSSSWGWELNSRCHSTLPWQTHAQGYRSPVGLGAWSRIEAMARGSQAHTTVYPGLAAFLWPQDEMLLSVPITHNVSDTSSWAACEVSGIMSLLSHDRNICTKSVTDMLISTKGSFKCIRVQAHTSPWPCFRTKAVPSNNAVPVNVTLKVAAVIP